MTERLLSQLTAGQYQPGDVLPSWVFLRNLGVANLIFTGAHLLAMLRAPQIYPSLAAQQAAKSH